MKTIIKASLMYIKSLHIDNFRNFTTFDTDFEPFTLITGANNSGKSNLFAALEKILSLTSPRNARISQQDFNNATLPIVIEITFHQLTDHDIAAFHHPLGLVNASTNTLKLHFEAKWDADEQDVVSECYFVRDDLTENQRRADYTRHYREYVSHYFTSSFQSPERELTFSQRQSFGKIIRSFAGDYLKPIDVLNNHLSESVKQLKAGVGLTPDETLPETERNEIIAQCDAIIGFCGDKDILQLETETDFDTIIQDLGEITTNFSNAVEKLKTAHPDEVDLKELFGQFDALFVQMEILAQRVSIRKDLSRWSTSLQATGSFKNANEQLAIVFKQLLLDQKLSFQMLPVGDEQLIGSVSAILGDFPLADHGDGYKSIFNIGLGLTEVLASEILNNRSSAITCLFIEEIEHNLHPHMQRHVINQLRELQKNWAESGRQLQIILTTHSPSCLKRVSPTEFILLRSDSRAIKWNEEHLEDLASKLEPEDANKDRRRKKFNQLSTWANRLFDEFAEAILNSVVIIVEGETEQGFITHLANLISDPDYYGIATIGADGEDNIQYVSAILSALEIPFVCIVDKDASISKAEKMEQLNLGFSEDVVFMTDMKAFEQEILKTKCYTEIIRSLEEFQSEDSTNKMLSNLKGNGFPGISNVDDLIGTLETLSGDQEEMLNQQLPLAKHKSVRFGQLLAKNMKENSPQQYINAIKKAESIVKG